jgi:hypothetical protein
MNVTTRAAAHLAVLGFGLVSAALHPAAAGATAAVSAAATSQLKPAVHRVSFATVALGPSRHRPIARSRRHHRHEATPAGRHQHEAPVQTARRPLPVQPAALRAPATRTGPTQWAALNAAIARIPTYRPGVVRWVVSGRYGHWGTADWYHAALYISPTVPASRLYDVAVHEWSHELSVLDYDADVITAVTAMNRYFGGQGLVGAERAADCMARVQGAAWTHYTACRDARWRSGAKLLLRGRTL